MDQQPTELWTDTTIEPGECVHWRIGPLGIWVRRTESEWRVADDRGLHETGAGENGLIVADRKSEPPAGVEWSRWAGDSDGAPFRLRPILPDRAVVVRPAQAVALLSRGSARIYVRIPVWIRAELATQPEATTLIDIPTVRLSNTWFGSLFEGELCYWVQTTARRTVEEIPHEIHVTVTPVQIINNADEQLPLEKICVGTEHLGIYQTGEELWTSQLKLIHSKEGDPQKLEPGKGPPPEAAEAELISPPRTKPKPGLASRAIGLVHSVPGAGFVMR